MLPTAMYSLYTNTKHQAGPTEKEEDGEDYENSAPLYKDLPPKPGSVAPPRPPKAGKKVENSPLPRKITKITALDLPPVTSTSNPLGVTHRDPPSFPPSLTTPAPATPGPWTSQKSRGSGCHWEERLLMFLCLLVATSLLLSGISLAVAVLKYQEVVETLRMVSVQQKAWQENVTGVGGLAGLKKDMDHVRAYTNQSLAELRALLECTKVTCPDDWLPFESKCYYFSPGTKSWDDARQFCQENYSHLVIIDSLAEHNFVAKAHGSSRVYWLGLNDKDKEGNWRWLDGSPVTLSFWEPHEPNNAFGSEDCASMKKDGTWNDLPCGTTTYWICEQKCSC